MASSINDYPLCPHCNTEIELDDTCDMDYDEEGITLCQVGHCPNCDKEYQWERSAACIRWENADLREV
jgi:hypothetical protein